MTVIQPEDATPTDPRKPAKPVAPPVQGVAENLGSIAKREPLAPIGAGFAITWNKHSRRQFQERVLSRGVSLTEFEALIRANNTTKRKDEPDPVYPRIRRYVRLPDATAVRVIFVLDPPGSGSSAEEMHVVTVLLEKRSI